ncbi:MAG: helix-turn-helix domain-containing protein [Chloroflexi bacterium]|nr:helix-turn-helix domain-containing protein [Chloroflexota bacterium]
MHHLAILREPLPEMTPPTIRAARDQLGLSQNELAQLLGTTGYTISRWETGSQPVRLPRMLYWALRGLGWQPTAQ